MDAETFFNNFEWHSIVALMDDEICHNLHGKIAPCSDFMFLKNYMYMHKNKFGTDFIIN